MRLETKRNILHQVELLRLHLGKNNVKSAQRYAQSIARQLQPFRHRPFMAAFRDMTLGQIIPVKTNISTFRVRASLAGRELGRRFSVLKSKSKPGQYICKRTK